MHAIMVAFGAWLTIVIVAWWFYFIFTGEWKWWREEAWWEE